MCLVLSVFFFSLSLDTKDLTADNSLFSIAMSLKTVTASALLAATASAKVYFHESFDDMAKWVASEKSDLGKFELSSGKFNGDSKINQGLRTTEDAKFYGAAAEIAEGFTNKDKDLVVSMSVKHEQGIGCGGGYIKIGPQMDLKKFTGESEYFLMFGPDKCGYTSKVHVIFGGYKKPDNNLLWKKTLLQAQVLYAPKDQHPPAHAQWNITFLERRRRWMRQRRHSAVSHLLKPSR